MLTGGGKAKGSSFERAVCQRLSLWVTDGAQKDCFWRSAISGGRATVAARKGQLLRRQAGDITAIAPEGHSLTDRFYIECKHVRSLNIDRFFITDTGELATYWRTAQKEAKRYGREPVLIARQNHFPILLLARPLTLVPMLQRTQLSKVIALSSADCEVYLFDDVLAQPYKESL